MPILNTIDNKSLIGNASQLSGDYLTFDGALVNNFSMIIPSLPTVEFFIQRFTLPTITVNEVEVQTRIVNYNEIGEKLNFEPIEVTFMCDKYMRNWSSIYNWMKGMTADGSVVGKQEDVILRMYNNDLFKFIGCWPMSLTGVELDSTVDSVQYVKATVTFNYDWMDLIGKTTTIDSSY